MSKNKSNQLCINCQYCGVAQYAADPSLKWYVCTHNYFKETFDDGRTLDLDDEPLAPWCPKPASEPRPPSTFEILAAKSEKPIKTGFGGGGFGAFEKQTVVIVTSDNSPTAVISNDKGLKDGREREVEVSSEDGIFGKSPW